MARPKKSGLSYFPLDTDFFDNDSRIKILKARYRADGIMIYVYLLCEIYKNGYYIQVDDDLEYIISICQTRIQRSSSRIRSHSQMETVSREGTTRNSMVKENIPIPEGKRDEYFI